MNVSGDNPSAKDTPTTREETAMADHIKHSPPPEGEGSGASTLLPMLIGGLALIMIGMVAVALLV